MNGTYSSVGAGSSDHGERCTEEDFDIEPRTPGGGVFQVESHHFIEIDRASTFVTCQRPVIPGLTSSSLRRCQVWYAASSYGIGGRGPTSDMSPRRTFRNCGSSSRLVLPQETCQSA